jgi:transposase-like protein
MLNVENEFRQPVSIDFAPAGSVCEWCGKPAMQEVTVLGGRGHNDSGYFCSACGKEFIRLVASDLRREMRTDEIDGPA